MQTSSIVAVAVGLGASSVPSLLSSAHAEGVATESKEAVKGSGTSLTDATGKLKPMRPTRRMTPRRSTSKRPRRGG